MEIGPKQTDASQSSIERTLHPERSNGQRPRGGGGEGAYCYSCIPLLLLLPLATTVLLHLLLSTPPAPKGRKREPLKML